MLARAGGRRRAEGKDTTLIAPGCSAEDEGSHEGRQRRGVQVVPSRCRLGGSVAVSGRRDGPYHRWNRPVNARAAGGEPMEVATWMVFEKQERRQRGGDSQLSTKSGSPGAREPS